MNLRLKSRPLNNNCDLGEMEVSLCGEVKDMRYYDYAFKPLTGRGPAFHWEWMVPSKHHGVKEARDIEQELHDVHNIGPYRKGGDISGDIPFVDGMGLCWLMGSTTPEDPELKPRHWYDGSMSYATIEGCIPWFRVDRLEDLKVHGEDIIEDNCVLYSNRCAYHIVDCEVDLIEGEVNADFLSVLKDIIDRRLIYKGMFIANSTLIGTFAGLHGNSIELFELKSYVVAEFIGTAYVDQQILAYKGKTYIYRSNVEIHMEAEALIDSLLS